MARADLLQAAGLVGDEGQEIVLGALGHDFIVQKEAGFCLAVPLMRRCLNEREGCRDIRHKGSSQHWRRHRSDEHNYQT